MQTKYSSKYKEAEANLWLICVPVHKSLKGLTITKEFIGIFLFIKFNAMFAIYFVNSAIRFFLNIGNEILLI